MNKLAYFRLMGLNKIAAEEDSKNKKLQSNNKAGTGKVTTKNWQTGSNRKRTGKFYSQLLGPGTSTLSTALLMALIGAAVSQNRTVGAVGGATAGLYGAGLANLAGTVAGMINGNRQPKDQNEYNANTSSTLKNYFIPGVAAYNSFRTGATNDEQNALITENTPAV